MRSTSPWVIRVRWALASLMLLIAAGAILLINTSSAFEQRGWKLFLMGIWRIGAVAIPAIVGIDFVGHLIYAIRKGVKGDVRGGGRTVAVTVVADALLLGCMLAAAVAILKFAK
jgi:hypothetical protein